MKYFLFFIFTLAVNFPQFSFANTDSLLHVLDIAIKEKSIYSKEKDLKIDSLKVKLNEASDDERRYNIYRDLFREYRTYNIDSALVIAYKRLEISEKQNNQNHINTSNFNIAEILSIAGMYKETLDILDNVKKNALADYQIPYYYHLYHSIYTSMSNYAFGEKEKTKYKALAYQYKDSLLLIYSPDSYGYQVIKTNKNLMEKKYEEALSDMKNMYKKYGQNENDVSVLAYELANVYHYTGDKESEKKYLAISAISDIKSATKEYISLRKLAVLLYQEGDVERAYNYMQCAIEDATTCKATFRTLETSEILPLIVSAYNLKMKQKQQMVYTYSIIISILSCLLILTVFFIYKQLKKVHSARESIKLMNQQLKTTNESLTTVNKKLSESDRVKEEYIGYVFNLCSTYINKLDSYHKSINKKITLNQINEIIRMTNSFSLVQDELKEFFHNFDTIFLNLYPNFITDFNSLLIENERILPKEGEVLTPELRIFALVRLGINDSTRIAKFLHYSPQTVYNYRLKIRNKSVLSKEDFVLAIQQIGIKS